MSGVLGGFFGIGRAGRCRRWRAAPTVAVAGILLLGGCAPAVGGVAAPPVVVGVDLDLGAPGGVDEVYHRALMLRAAQINQRAGAGDRRVELRVRDNAADPVRSAANLAELAADPQVSAIVTGSCGECLAQAAGDIEAGAVPVISLSAGAVIEPASEHRFVFRIAPEAVGSADVMAGELAARGVATIGLVASGDAYGRDGARELSEATAAFGLDLPASGFLDGGEQGRDELAHRLAGWRAAAPADSADPADSAVSPAPADSAAPAAGGLDAVVVWTGERDAVALAVALRRAGFQGPLWLEARAAGPLVVGSEEAAAALSGARLLFADTLVADDVVAALPELARRAEWFSAYTARYGVYHARASFAADALDLVVSAVDRIGTDPHRVRDTLEALQLPGLSGGVGFSPASHSGLDARSLSVLRFDGDRWRATGA